MDSSTLWVIDRLAMQGILLTVLGIILWIVWKNAKNNRNIAQQITSLLAQGREDSEIRTAVAERLEARTKELEERTARALSDHNEAVLQKLEETRSTAAAAAEESRNAANTANALNEKIYDTNARLLETNAKLLKTSNDKVMDQQIQDTASLHEHIGQVDNKVSRVDDKVEAILEDKKE